MAAGVLASLPRYDLLVNESPTGLETQLASLAARVRGVSRGWALDLMYMTPGGQKVRCHGRWLVSSNNGNVQCITGTHIAVVKSAGIGVRDAGSHLSLHVQTYVGWSFNRRKCVAEGVGMSDGGWPRLVHSRWWYHRRCVTPSSIERFRTSHQHMEALGLFLRICAFFSNRSSEATATADHFPRSAGFEEEYKTGDEMLMVARSLVTDRLLLFVPAWVYVACLVLAAALTRVSEILTSCTRRCNACCRRYFVSVCCLVLGEHLATGPGHAARSARSELSRFFCETPCSIF